MPYGYERRRLRAAICEDNCMMEPEMRNCKRDCGSCGWDIGEHRRRVKRVKNLDLKVNQETGNRYLSIRKKNPFL